MSEPTPEQRETGAEDAARCSPLVAAVDEDTDPNALDYTRRLFATVSGWYANADSKAQILLTLNGALLGFLGSAAFWGADKLDTILPKVGYETLVFFVAFLVALAASITSALMCLKSRLRRLEQHEEDKEEPTDANVWFFQLLPSVKVGKFPAALRQVTAETEIRILSSQIQILSFNVISKHVWVNRGFKGFVAGLLFFILVVATYVIRLAAGVTDRFSFEMLFGCVVVIATAATIYLTLNSFEEHRAYVFQRRFSPSAKRSERNESQRPDRGAGSTPADGSSGKAA